MTEHDDNRPDIFAKKMSRREFLKKAGLTGAGALVGGSVVGGMLNQQLANNQKKNLGGETVPFYGKHQAGILGAAQKSTYFAVLDLETTDRADIIQMFKDWTAYTANLTQGKNVEQESGNRYLPPRDTGETVGLSPYRLTVTFGVSLSFLKKLGLSAKIVPAFRDLPPFPGEQIEDRYRGGDIVIQACADDDQVAFHAVRNLIRKGRGNLAMRWSQSGFLPIGDGKETPRNLFGFKDGTANLEAVKKQDEVIWHTANDWLKNGSFMVVRKIRMHLETWDRTNLREQERTFGRYKQSGAPFGETDEFAAVDITKKDKDGNFLIPVDSHVHLAKKSGFELYRRAYSYSDGINEQTGQFEAGLLFVSFQKDPNQFIKIQTMLGAQDRLNEYITHIGSGVFACFGGIKEGDYIGQKLFE